jgi:hypothetical protein
MLEPNILLIATNDIPYISIAKWVICLFLIGSDIYNLKQFIQKKQVMNGLIGIISIIITIFMVPYIFKA